MQVELYELETFLAEYPPFHTLPERVRQDCARNCEISYFKAGSTIFDYGAPIYHLYIIRSGVVEIYRRKGALHNRLTEGDIFGEMGLLMNNRVRLPAKAIEDTLVYLLPDEIFKSLIDEYEEFSDYVEVEDITRLHTAVTSQVDVNDMTTSKVHTLLSREAVIISAADSIQRAAQLMAQEHISALLVEEPPIQKNAEAQQSPSLHRQYLGIITDRDLCTRVLAAGLSPESPVRDVMSRELIVLDHQDYVFEAMMTMLRNNVHHLPVFKKQQPLGIVEVTDIVRYESQSSLLLVNSVTGQLSVADLAEVSLQVKACFKRMVNEDANSHMVGSAMSVIGRAFIQRLTELAEETLGEPPIPYCFLTMGSMARDEQLVVTDQDNGLILDEGYQPLVHDDYFQRFADFVCEGLAACGYATCSGGIMASNPEWRKTLAQWRECFSLWIDEPNPQALLNSSIFFDLDGVCGEIAWSMDLLNHIVAKAEDNDRFLACMARNALNRTPPLGFFKNFVMEKDGRQNNSINLKRRGTAPLGDIIRVHALAAGSMARNSFERLDDVIESGLLPEGKGQDLRDALEFISLVRMRHQAMDIDQGIEPDNNIEPENMSDFERRHLKDAFQVLSTGQNFLKYRYHASRMK